MLSWRGLGCFCRTAGGHGCVSGGHLQQRKASLTSFWHLYHLWSYPCHVHKSLTFQTFPLPKPRQPQGILGSFHIWNCGLYPWGNRESVTGPLNFKGQSLGFMSCLTASFLKFQTADPRMHLWQDSFYVFFFSTTCDQGFVHSQTLLVYFLLQHELHTFVFQIRVNTINPTVTMTPMGRKAWSDPVKSQEMIKKIPMGRFVGEAVSLFISVGLVT